MTNPTSEKAYLRQICCNYHQTLINTLPFPSAFLSSTSCLGSSLLSKKHISTCINVPSIKKKETWKNKWEVSTIQSATNYSVSLTNIEVWLGGGQMSLQRPRGRASGLILLYMWIGLILLLVWFQGWFYWTKGTVVVGVWLCCLLPLQLLPAQLNT